jgi:UDP-glucose 4-epimerase
MFRRTAIGGGGGFIGRHLCAAIAGSLAFGREGPPAGRCAALVWAAGGRAGLPAELHMQHATRPAEAIAALRPRRVIYLSSAEVYGQQAVPFSETSPVAPVTNYGRAKCMGEAAVAEACASVHAELVILRPGVVYGPGQGPTMLIPTALTALRAGLPFPTGDGRPTRDFVHVDDLVALIRRCLLSDAPPDVYNAGSGREVCVREVLSTLAAAVGPRAKDLLRFGARAPREGEAVRYVLDVRRARDRLGWSTAVELEAGLRRLASD